MKTILTILLTCGIIGCTTVNVYSNSEPSVVIIKNPPSARNADNPYLR